MILYILVFELKSGHFAARVFRSSDAVELFCKYHKVIDVIPMGLKLDICGEE